MGRHQGNERNLYWGRGGEMSNKVCEKCHIFDDMHDYCIIAGDRHANSPACDCFVDKCQKSTSPTVFDRITKSPEVLAEKLVYEESLIKPDGTYVCRYFSTIIDGGCWLDEEEAFAATVAKLKEVVE